MTRWVGGGLILALLCATAPASAGEAVCPEFDRALQVIDESLLGLDVDAAWSSLREAEDALLDCDVVIRPEQFGNLWLREGVLESLRGNKDASDDAFGAAGRVAPDLWNDQYGSALKARYDLARVRPLKPAGLRLLPPPGGNRVLIDGTEIASTSSLRIDAESGLHGVQLLDPAGIVRFSQVLWIAPNDTATVETGVAPAPMPEPVPVPQPPVLRRERQPIDPVLVGGIVGVVAGGALLAVSFDRSAAMQDATTPRQLKSTYDLHVASRIGGLGLVGLGAAGIGASFVF